jgi:hypothetical protein
MPFLDEVSQRIDLSKKLDTPVGFFVTPPAPLGFSVAETQFLFYGGLAVLTLLLVGIFKRAAVLLFLKEASLNTAAIGLNTWRAAQYRSRSIGSEIKRRASDKVERSRLS